MKLSISIAAALAIGALTAAAQTQNPGGPGGPGRPGGFGGPGGRRHHPPPMPLIVVLDANTNHVLEASEIANAPTALLTLDVNKDGKVSQDELMPPPPPGAPPRPAPPQGMRHPVSPLMKALDLNGDGQLDADEIANASKSLLTLDTNADGQLTPDEFRPPWPGGPRPDGAPGAPPPDGAPAGPPPQQ